MGTATQVIDAQNTLNGLKAETALNAFKYVMSLATLLQSHGSIQQFQSYINQPNTPHISLNSHGESYESGSKFKRDHRRAPKP